MRVSMNWEDECARHTATSNSFLHMVMNIKKYWFRCAFMQARAMQRPSCSLAAYEQKQLHIDISRQTAHLLLLSVRMASGRLKAGYAQCIMQSRRKHATRHHGWVGANPKASVEPACMKNKTKVTGWNLVLLGSRLLQLPGSTPFVVRCPLARSVLCPCNTTQDMRVCNDPADAPHQNIM